MSDYTACEWCAYPHPPWVGCMSLHPASRPVAATPTPRLRLTRHEWAELLRMGKVRLSNGTLLEVEGG